MVKKTIKTSVLIIILSLVGSLSVLFISLQYYNSNKVAMGSTTKIFKLISDNISNNIQRDNATVENVLEVNIHNKNFFHTIDFMYDNAALADMIQIMSMNENLHSIFIADKEQSFFQLIDMSTSSLLHTRLNAPLATKWAVIIIIKNKTKFVFLDKEKKLISEYMKENDFNPHTRVWYKAALKSNSSITTKPYIFANIKNLGITYAIHLNKEGSVLGVDYTMKGINKVLSLQKFEESAEIFIFDKNGKKVASSNSNTNNIDEELYKILLNSASNSVLNYEKNSDYYFTMYAPLATKGFFLGIKVNSDNLLEPYMKNIRTSLIIAFILMFLSGIVAIFATGIIVKPIKKLIFENEKIKKRNFDKVAMIETEIIEFVELSSSFVSMSKSIQYHKINYWTLL